MPRATPPHLTTPTPASTPRAGAGRGAAPACGEIAEAYLRLVEAIRASAARGDATAEDRLRNRAQAVLGRMHALRCPLPAPAYRGPVAGRARRNVLPVGPLPSSAGVPPCATALPRSTRRRRNPGLHGTALADASP